MKDRRKEFEKTYNQIFDLLENMESKSRFKNFEETLRVEDGMLMVFNSLYYLIENLEEIETDKNIVFSLLEFENILSKGRLATLIHRALDMGVSIEDFDDATYDRLLSLNDKDIKIQLAKNQNISDSIARKLMDGVYQVLKNLLENKVLSHGVKEEIIDYISNNEKDVNMQKLLKEKIIT